MEKQKPPITGMVTKLGIVAHGDRPGVVQLDSLLTTEIVPTVSYQLVRLRLFLAKEARLIFFSCIAGSGPAGTALLNELSRRLLGCIVIGFEVSGRMGSTGIPNKPGKITADLSMPGFKPDPVKANPSGSQILDEYSWFSKWSKNGVVIRIGLLEQGAPGRNNRCASPACRGHAKPYERCQAFQ